MTECPFCNSLEWQIHLRDLLLGSSALLLFVTFVLTADQSTTVRREKIVTYVLSFARTECYRFIVVVVEPAVGEWCAHSVGRYVGVLIVLLVRSRHGGCYLHLSLSV